MSEITYLYKEDRDRELYMSFLRGSTIEELCKRFHLCKRYVQAIIRTQRKGGKEWKMEKPEEKLLGAIFKLNFSEDELFREVDGHTLREVIESLLDTLASKYERSKPHFSKRVKELMLQRFGFTTGQAMTLEEVGHNLNITRERVRQQEALALRMLRHPSIAVYLRPYVKW